MSKELNTVAPKKWVANYSGVAPTIDTSDGVYVGDLAIDSSTTPNLIWQCQVNTNGAPIWKRLLGESFKIKTADQSWTSDTVLANVTASTGNLDAAVEANVNYVIDFYVFVTHNATGDVSFAITGPAAPTAVRYGVAYGGTTHGGASAFSTRIDCSMGTASAVEPAVIRCILRNGANAGTVTLQAAQRVSNATATTIHSEGVCKARILL